MPERCWVPAAAAVLAVMLTGPADAGARLVDDVIEPGNSPGCTVDEGNVTLNSGAVLRIEIGGTEACTDYDRYTVQQVLRINGATLEVILLPGFVPAPGMVFDVLDWGSLVGGFGTIDFSAAVLADGDEWDTSRLETTGELVVGPLPVPVPGWALLAGGAVMLLRASGLRPAARS